MDFAVKFPGGYNMNSVNEILWHRRWPTKGLIPSGVVPRPEKYDGPALLVLAPDSQEPETGARASSPWRSWRMVGTVEFFGNLNDHLM